METSELPETPSERRWHRFDVPPVGDLITSHVIRTRPDVSLDSIRHLLLDEAISGVPVVDDHGKPLGMISKTDLLRASEEGPELEELVEDRDASQRLGYEARIVRLGTRTVYEIMTPRVLTITRHTSALSAARIMAEARVHRLVVVDSEGLACGVLSSLDLLDWIGHGDTGE